MRFAMLLTAAMFTAACSKPKPAEGPPPSQRPAAPASTPARPAQPVRDVTELERRIALLELRLIEKETLIEELQTRLDESRSDVVKTMSRLQTVASRAEAASGIAEADVAFQSLRLSVGQPLPVTGQVAKLIQQSSAEFNRQNYGGALYLATQARTMASSYRAPGTRETLRPGETPFALPIRLKATSNGNVREGPGTNYGVAFTVAAGNALAGYSYTDEWIRITDEAGRPGWIFYGLVGRP